MMLGRKKRNMNSSVIKRGIDHLPYGIAFAQRNGIVNLCNYEMHKLSHALCGNALQNADAFWKTVTSHEVLRNGYLVHLPSGEKWHLHRYDGMINGRPIYEYHANNVTEQVRLTDELKAENDRLKLFADRMHQLNCNALDLTARKELLERKAHTHDELGRLLQATRTFLFNGNAEEDSLWQQWHINAGLMLEETRLSKDTDPMNSLYGVANSIGVKVEVSGDLPEDMGIAELFFAACGESLTNLLRHAHGTQLHVSIETDGSVCKVTLTNNGTQPTEEITEGGGLSALRQRVENSGGTMMIYSVPEYKLILTLQKRRKAYYDSYTDR